MSHASGLRLPLRLHFHVDLGGLLELIGHFVRDFLRVACGVAAASIFAFTPEK